MIRPRYVFLDQNHWIYLARDYWGRPSQPRHAGVAFDLLSKVQSGHVRLPLNTIHLIEHLRNADADARKRLAEVYEIYSGGWFFAAWSDVIPVELAQVLKQIFGQPDKTEWSVFGRGFMFGVGASERELLEKFCSDIEFLGWLTACPGALIDLLTCENEHNRRLQNTQIAKIGRDDAVAIEQLRSQRKPFPKTIHRQAQYARYTLSFQRQVAQLLSSLGRSLDDFVSLGPDGLMDFWSRVPSLDVDCELTMYRDRQWSRNVEPNDISDVGHLALALPYCDVVVVERFWNRAICETELSEKHGTQIFTDIRDLTDSL
jgi:hypothetical protein